MSELVTYCAIRICYSDCHISVTMEYVVYGWGLWLKRVHG